VAPPDAAHDGDEHRQLVARAAERVRSDIEATTGLRWDYTIIGPRSLGEFLCYPPGGGVIPMVSAEASLEEATVIIAENHSGEVAEHLADEHRLAEAQRWPPCPQEGHDHAMDPALSDGVAVWVCRSDPTVRVTIGALR
jgi:hypothetical protein